MENQRKKLWSRGWREKEPFGSYWLLQLAYLHPLWFRYFIYLSLIFFTNHLYIGMKKCNSWEAQVLWLGPYREEGTEAGVTLRLVRPQGGSPSLILYSLLAAVGGAANPRAWTRAMAMNMGEKRKMWGNQKGKLRLGEQLSLGDDWKGS